MPSTDERQARWDALRSKLQIGTDIGENLLGLPEAALTMGTGFAAQAGSGLGTAAGVVGSLVRGEKPDWDAASDAANENTERFTYAPRSAGGQASLGGLGTVMSPLDKGMNWVGEQTAEKTGSPALGALVKGGLNILDPEHLAPVAAALKGSRGLTRLIDETPESAGVPSAGRMGAQRGAFDPTTGKKKPKKQAAVGGLFDEVTDPQEALAMALRGEHLKTSHAGEIVGAPEGIKTKRDVNRLRREADKQVEAGVEGMDWYDRARRKAVEVSPEGDTAMQSQFARGGAAYSPQATPPTEVAALLKQHNAKMLTGEDVRPRTAAQMKGVARSYDTPGEIRPENIKLGKKTGPYADAKDPTVPEESLFKTANDIWHGRVMGYGEDFSRGFTPQEHGYLTGENLLLAERAKARDAAAGVERQAEWNPRSAQAATWTAKRKEQYVATALAARKKKGLTTSPEELAAIEREAAESARAGIPEAVAKNRAFLTSESRTGSGLGHWEMDAGDPLIQQQADLARTPRNAIFDALRMYSEPNVPTRGYFKNPEGVVERNPGTASPLLVSSDFGKGGPQVSAPERALLDRAAMHDAFSGVQHATAWSRFFPEGQGKQNVKGMNAAMVEHGDLTPEQIAQLEQAAESIGAQPTNIGPATLVAKFGDAGAVPGTTKEIINALRDTEGKATRGTVQTGYEPSGHIAAQGTGAATERYLGRSAELEGELPGIEAREAPAVASENARLNAVDDELAKIAGEDRGRADVRKAREILATGGIPALRDYVKKFGSAGLPAVVLGLLGMQEEGEQSEQPQT